MEAAVFENATLTESENAVWREAVIRAGSDPALLKQLGLASNSLSQISERVVEDGPESFEESFEEPVEESYDGPKRRHKKAKKSDPPKFDPICNRCHELKHHHQAPPLPAYPTLETLATLLQTSRHKHNHIYHLIDAADFPMTLRPSMQRYLYKNLPKSITRNLTISYVITRCDILSPARESVASLMTYLKSVLKEKLPENQRVESPYNKIYAISSRSGWDIGKLKDEIASRRGGVWIVGAVNVGKSTLMRDIWPKGGVLRPVDLNDAAEFDILPENHAEIDYVDQEYYDDIPDLPPLDAADATPPELDQILASAVEKTIEKPAKPNTARPADYIPPLISEVPGTTAAPLRVSYISANRGGKLKGEVVDLPGLERWVGFPGTGLMPYVRPDRHRMLSMKKRINPEQITLKPGQSIVLGGLVMITPKTETLHVQINPFTVLPVHVARTEKCRPQDTDHKQSWLMPDAVTPLPTAFKSAGVFTLAEDVTPRRNPMLKSKSPEALKMLPYKVLATDIVMDGIGWVEISCQVRNRRDTGYQTVDVEVFTPEGKGVMQRRCMELYMRLEESARNAGLRSGKHVRPRGSKKGEKKQMKIARRVRSNVG
ncbi:hypothetical protein FPQ18DRAFT_263516 [Pyronema domesticum]|nr:hypothetical protein FPQ18DRAFT_263516 [Pyronema domesticum]